MFKEFVCELNKKELEELYIFEKKTLKQMCGIVGCKSPITMAKILNQNGISTNNNDRVAYAKRGNKTDEEFKKFLISEYSNNRRSMTSIAKEMNISWVVVSRYLDKYGIPKRTKSQQMTGELSPSWKGGRRIKKNGYVEIYSPNHPKRNARGCVYEHQLVMEKHIGRYLRENEVVHHIDRDKTNNDISNLLLLTRSEHTKLHLREGDMKRTKRSKNGIS